MSDRAAIVLAAGKSTRMKSDLPKVLHELCGRPMLHHVLNACRLVGVESMMAVVGHGKSQVLKRFENETDVVWVEQAKQRGTGHAVACCRKALEGLDGSLLVIAGDMPLVRRETLAGLIESREQSQAAVTLATAVLNDPTGYGRIVRNAKGKLEAIVEESDCTSEQQKIREVNPSYYCFDAVRLFAALDEIKPTGAKGEYYLTDAIRILRSNGHEVSASVTVAAEDAMGINSRLDLATVNRVMQDRIQFGLMGDGVTIVDPDNTWIESDVTIGRDTVVHPFTLIVAGATVGEGCQIGPFARVDTGEVVEDGSVVGPMVFNGAAAS